MALVLADRFIDILVEAGIIPRETTEVIIHAKIGNLTEIHYNTIWSDEEIITAIAAAVKEAHLEISQKAS